MKNGKNAIVTIFSFVLIGGGLLAYLISAVINIVHMSGIIPLNKDVSVLNKGEYIEKEFDYVYGPRLVVSNSINGLIPIGKEYYYVAFDDETGIVYFIRASKGLQRKKEVVNEEPVVIKGKVRTADTDSARNLSDDMEYYVSEGFRKSYADRVLFVDNTIMFQSVLRVVSIVLMAAGIAGMIISPTLRNKPANTYSAFDKLYVGACLISLILGLVVAMYTTSFLF